MAILTEMGTDEMKEILNNLSCLVINFSADYKIEWVNKKTREIYKAELSEFEGEHCYKVLNNKKDICKGCPMKAVFSSGEMAKKEIKDLEGKIWEMKFYPRKDNSNLNGGFIIGYNVTRPKMIESRLKERSEIFQKVSSKFHRSKEEFNSLFVHNPDGICAIDLEGRLISANPAIDDITGFDPEEIIETYFENYIKDSDKKRIHSYFQRAALGYSQEFVTSIVCHDGSKVITSIKFFPMVIDGEIIAIYAIIKDITEKKEIEKKLKIRAYYDSLTDLPNKHYVDEKLNKLLKLDQKAAVMFLDLDRFKRINDSLGHSTGDRLLKRAATRLNETIKEGIVARYSGDEFIIILDQISTKSEVEEWAKKIAEKFSAPFSINNRSIFLSFSIGISIYPDDEIDKSTLIKDAYMAMYKAKTKVEEIYHFFEAGLIKEKTLNNNKLNMESELRKAIKNNDFMLYYQPQIDLYNGEISGFEALIRWNHKKLGKISPADFIPLAEETGLIQSIGSWVLKTACQQSRIWQEEGYAPVRMAVNVSIYQLKDPNFVLEVEEMISKTELDPAYIELEITENIMRNLNELEVILNRLKNIGVKISIDDFGTGYSSLSVLQGLPINTLKIDQSFIDKSTIDNRSAALVKTIIAMGSNLGLNVIAEGIEKREQVALLKENNCRIGQGFLFSRPLPVSEIVDIFDFNSSGFILNNE